MVTFGRLVMLSLMPLAIGCGAASRGRPDGHLRQGVTEVAPASESSAASRGPKASEGPLEPTRSAEEDANAPGPAPKTQGGKPVAGSDTPDDGEDGVGGDSAQAVPQAPPQGAPGAAGAPDTGPASPAPTIDPGSAPKTPETPEAPPPPTIVVVTVSVPTELTPDAEVLLRLEPQGTSSQQEGDESGGDVVEATVAAGSAAATESTTEVGPLPGDTNVTVAVVLPDEGAEEGVEDDVQGTEDEEAADMPTVDTAQGDGIHSSTAGSADTQEVTGETAATTPDDLPQASDEVAASVVGCAVKVTAHAGHSAKEKQKSHKPEKEPKGKGAVFSHLAYVQGDYVECVQVVALPRGQSRLLIVTPSLLP